MPAIETIKLRRGTAAQWTAANPILADGETGYETDTGNLKIGDGSTSWVSLPYRVQPGAYASTAASAPTQSFLSTAPLQIAPTSTPATPEFHWMAPFLTNSADPQRWLTGSTNAARSEWGIGLDQSAAIPLRDFVIGFKFLRRAVDDITWDAGSPTVINSPAIANFTSKDVGAAAIGPNIPAGTTIKSVQSGTQATLSAACTANPGIVTIVRAGSVSDSDGIYGSHNGGAPASWAFGQPTPDRAYRLRAVGDPTAGGTMGGFLAQAGYSPTVTQAAGGVNGAGFPFATRDWGGKDRAWWDNSNNNTWTLRLRADTNTTNPSFVIQDLATDTAVAQITAQGFIVLGNAGLAATPGVTFTNTVTTGKVVMATTGEMTIGNSNATLITIGNHITGWNALGFFGSPGGLKPTVSGSKGGNAALASLLTALSGLGLLTDSST